MRKKIFLMGSCRIHRPFNSDCGHKNGGKFNLYDCLNTKWHRPCFLGSLYESSYILQTLKFLSERKIKYKENIQHLPHQKPTDKKHFLKLRYKLMTADIIIIEIATLKYCMNDDNFYLSTEHNKLMGIKPTKEGKLTRKQLIDNIKEIENVVHEIGKKVLFVSHFNHDHINQPNLPNRRIIIESLKNTAKHYFNPTDVITSESKLSDPTHYNLNTEAEIMEEIHKKLSSM